MESVCPPPSSPPSSWWAPLLSAENKNNSVQTNKFKTCHPETKLFFSSIKEPMTLSPARPATLLREPVSRMQLVFDEDDDEEEGKRTADEDHRAPADTRFGSSRAPQEPAGSFAPQDPGWDAGGASCIVVITLLMRERKNLNSSHTLGLLSVRL